MSTGLVYNYFDSKESLLVCLIESKTAEMKFVAQSLSADEGSLSRLIDQYFEFLKNEKRFLRLQLTLLLMPELPSIVREAQDARAAALLNQVT